MTGESDSSGTEVTGGTGPTGTERSAENDSTMLPQNTPVVLVVEDEPDYADMYREWLEQEYEVIAARSGTVALDRIDETVDVVLLDRKLPDMRGRAVLEEIRDRELPCQVVVVSAIDPDADVLDLGFDDYLTKPATEADLTAAVERSLTRMTYARRYQEFMALATKLATLEANMDVDELEACSEYTERRQRFAEMAEELGQLSVGDDEYRELYQTKLDVLLDSTHASTLNR